MNAPVNTVNTPVNAPVPAAPQGQITAIAQPGQTDPGQTAPAEAGWKYWTIRIGKSVGLMLCGALIGVAADRTLQARRAAEATHQP